jgi:hypothetical protein
MLRGDNLLLDFSLPHQYLDPLEKKSVEFPNYLTEISKA